MDGDPPIQIGRVSGTGDRGVLISVLTLQAGEDRTVAAAAVDPAGRSRTALRAVGQPWRTVPHGLCPITTVWTSASPRA